MPRDGDLIDEGIEYGRPRRPRPEDFPFDCIRPLTEAEIEEQKARYRAVLTEE